MILIMVSSIMRMEKLFIMRVGFRQGKGMEMEHLIDKTGKKNIKEIGNPEIGMEKEHGIGKMAKNITLVIL